MGCQFDNICKLVRFHKMKMKSVFPLIWILAFVAFSSDSVTAISIPGTFQKEQSPWPVTDTGVTLMLPFLGGFNDPKPALVDFNNDGLCDLMIGQIDGSLLYLKNTGTDSVPAWTPQEERLGGINVGTWYTFCDIDGDNNPDLFCDSKTGKIKYYRNESVGDNISFQLIDTAFSSFKNGGDSALLTGLNNTPAFADIDNDNDYDYFFGALSGKVEFHRNIGDSINYSFEFVTDFYDSVYAFPAGPVPSSESRHGYSNISFADHDNDNDLDLFFGDIFNPNAYFFQNDGTADSSDLNLISEDFPNVNTSGFNHLVFSDLDGDSDKDMVLGVAQSAQLNNLWILRNQSGTYVEETRNLITQIDIGSQSMPALADLDADGDIDMLVGGSSGQLKYYQNVGTPENPSFNKVTDAFGGIDVGSFSAPALIDWDNDIDLDLLVGNINGRIEHWRNDGDSTNFIATLVTNQLSGIKVDQLAVPVPVDWDNDGLIDLVVGEWDFNGFANVLLYENTGTLGNPVLTLVTNRLIKREQMDFTIPIVYDWDLDGKKDLIIGGKYVGLTLYNNTAAGGQFPDSLTLIKSAAVIPGNDAGQCLSMAFSDIDNDGDKDVFVGEEFGGVNFYRLSTSTCCIGRRGDLNNDGTDANLLDLTFAVDRIFRSGPPADCSVEADVNGDGTVLNVLDLTFLVDRIFRGGTISPLCP